MTFKTSINVKFDIGNDEFIKRYIPTPSHTEAMSGIIGGFINPKSNHSHIIMGPYGTGKSLLANVIGGISSKLVNSNEIDLLVHKYNQIDDTLAHKLNQISTLKKIFLPIVLNGNEGRFKQSILSNIIKKLKEQEIDILLPGLVNKIINAIDLWRQEFPVTYQAFTSKLQQDGKELERWITEIKRQNEEEILYFSRIYPTLTSGSTFDVDFDYNFISQLQYIESILQKHNLGLFIIYDEFSRFLQGLNNDNFNETMQDIQDLAEFSNRTDSIHLLLITHKSLRNYYLGGEEVSQEFQRIEKRFNQYFIQSDQATFLRISEIIMLENVKEKPQISTEQFLETQGEMRKYPLFPSLNQTERDELIIKSMYPLHPIALYMLPHLTRVFGQNERTLFTFLESEETSGFLNHIMKSNQYFLAHKLFDYFFPDFNEYIHNNEFSEYFVLYKKSISRIPSDLKNKQLAVNIVKVIALWNICSLQNEIKLVNDFLAFSLDVSEEVLESLLAILSENKIIRFNRINHYWELFAGNSIDLIKKLEDEKQSLKIEEHVEQEILYKNLEKKHYFPEKYNDEKGMTRYASIKLIYAEEILENRWGKFDNNADLVIYYVLPNNETTIELIKPILLEKSKQESVLFFTHPSSVAKVRTEVVNNIALEMLNKNKGLKTEDIGLKEELDILINESNYVIKSYLSEINLFKKGNEWVYSGEKGEVKNEYELAEILSNKCYRLYKHTPVVLNDSFNRNNISGAQRTAVIQLINNIIEQPHVEQFGVTGYGPEYMIYASVFKNNERLDDNINRMDYSNIKYEPYAILRCKLIDILEKSPAGCFQDIINIFTNEYFGIRKPIIPLLLVALLRDRWNEFMLYRNAMYVPGLKGEKLFEIITQSGPDNYHYVYEKISEDYIKFFIQIELLFDDFLEERLDNQSRLIFVCGTLLKWVRALPRITQMSEQVDDDFSWLRDCIRRSEIDPQQSISLLFKKYYLRVDELSDIKEYAENYIFKIKDRISVEIFKTFSVKNIDSLKEIVINKYNEGTQLKNKLLEKLYFALTEKNTNAWIDCFLEDYIGVKIDEWSETTFNLFLSQLAHDYNETKSDSESKRVVIQLNDRKKFIDIVELSVKSNTIYNNLARVINTAGRNVPQQELEFLVYKLFEKYVVTPE